MADVAVVTSLTPFTYLIEGLVANAMGGLQIRCTDDEYLRVTPPAGEQCVSWLEPFTSGAAGYAEVLANGDCGYCQVRPFWKSFC